MTENELIAYESAWKFMELHRHGLAYCRELGGWKQWNGMVWEWVQDDCIVKMVRQEIEKWWWSRAIACRIGEDKNLLTQSAIKCRQSNILALILEHAKGVLSHSANSFNRCTDFFNTKSGVLDLPSGRVFPHYEGWHITRLAGTGICESDCPQWMSFISRATSDDPQSLKDLQRAVGALLPQKQADKEFFLLHGAGNAKELFVKTLEGVLGSYSDSMKNTLAITDHFDDLTGNTYYAKRTEGQLVAYVEPRKKGDRKIPHFRDLPIIGKLCLIPFAADGSDSLAEDFKFESPGILQWLVLANRETRKSVVTQSNIFEDAKP